MSKYSIFATKRDWEKLYEYVARFPELDIKSFKKSNSFDMAIIAFYAFIRRHEGLSNEEAMTKYPLSVYDQTIKATV